MEIKKIESRLNQLHILAELVIKETTMLKRELIDVVSNNSPQKGLTAKALVDVKLRGEKRRTRTK
jgi:hypothetical protein